MRIEDKIFFFKFKVNKHLVVQSYCELEVHLYIGKISDDKH